MIAADIDLKERLSKLLTKAQALAKKNLAPVTTSLSLREALRGGFDREFEETARAGRSPVLVLISGTVEKNGRVQVWGIPAKKHNPCRDYAETGMGPSALWRASKKEA